MPTTEQYTTKHILYYKYLKRYEYNGWGPLYAEEEKRPLHFCAASQSSRNSSIYLFMREKERWKREKRSSSESEKKVCVHRFHFFAFIRNCWMPHCPHWYPENSSHARNHASVSKWKRHSVAWRGPQSVITKSVVGIQYSGYPRIESSVPCRSYTINIARHTEWMKSYNYRRKKNGPSDV